MKIFLIVVIALLIGVGVGGGWSGMRAAEAADGKQIVGVWFVTFPDAPFKYHMCTFHADGTMEQANPDAGDAHTSDSDGMGVWVREGGKIKGKFVEVTADRTTRQFVSRGEISFTLDVDGDRFAGNAVGKFYDLDNKLTFGPVNTAMQGTKIGL
ncbi:MAG: hypothetical protein ABJA02_11440 [Acidobacteriota bacterium]